MKYSKYYLTILAIIVLFLSCTEANAAHDSSDLSFKIINKSDSGMLIEITATNYKIAPSSYQPYQAITMKGCSIIKQSGAPAVVIGGQLLEIPEGCDIELSVQTIEKINVQNILLTPAPERAVEEDASGAQYIQEHFRADAQIYSTDAYFPGVLAKIDLIGYLRDKRICKVNFYPLQYNPVKKNLEIYKRFNVSIKYHYLNNTGIKAENQKLTTVAKFNNKIIASFKNIYASCLLNYNSEKENLSRIPLTLKAEGVNKTPSLYTENSPYAVRVTITEEGIYKIAYEDLSSLGVNLSSTTNEKLKMENQGNEISVYRSGTGAFKAGDYILFYGEPFKSLYTKKNVYWIYQGSGAGKKMGAIDGSHTAGYTIQQSFKSSYHGEEDHEYWETIPNGDGVDHWFWVKLTPTETATDSATFIAHLLQLDTTSGNYSMKINLRGKTTPAHHTKVSVNGNGVADITWSDQIELTKDIPNLAPALFNNGDNSIKIEEELDSGTIVDTIYVNWFDINYAANFIAEDNQLKFTGEGSGGLAFAINNFTNSDIWTFDITDTATVSQITNPKIEQSGSSYTVTFGDSVAGRKTYYAVSSNTFNKPSELTIDEPSNLKSPRADIDYIIITHENFYDTVQALKDYRESKGLHVEVVKIQDVYDEFSYGLKDAHAIRDFLTYAYNNWHATDHPTYVLLVGGASIDYRDDTGNFESTGRIDFVPTYLFQTAELGDTPTDNWFVCVNGSDPIPDMIIGRLSVKTTDDLNNIIDKIKAYEQGSAGAWTKNVIFASDTDQVFVDTSDTLAALLPENYNPEKVYLSNYAKVEDATSDLVNKINAGSLITNYTGHGSVDNWSGEFLFHTPDAKDNIPRNDVDRLTNGNMLTFVMTLNCLNGFFPNFVNDYSLADEIVRAKDKGAIACLAPTGLGYTSEHEVLAENIFKRLFKDNDNIAGSVCYTSKINAYKELGSQDIMETFTLFGDPATALKLSSVASSIKLMNPGDSSVLQRTARSTSTFTWENNQGSSIKYKIQFSKDSTFPDNKTITAPLFNAKFITGTEYTPNIFIWMILNFMSIKNENIYWRVAGYDANNNPVEYSQHRSFKITK